MNQPRDQHAIRRALKGDYQALNDIEQQLLILRMVRPHTIPEDEGGDPSGEEDGTMDYRIARQALSPNGRAIGYVFEKSADFDYKAMRPGATGPNLVTDCNGVIQG